MKTRVTDIISFKDIDTWEPDTPVIIKAGTGVGKSYFIKNTLYDYAKEQGEKILMLIHRKRCVEQFRMEIKEAGKTDVIKIMTYQTLESAKNESIEIEQYRYVVCDEFHYFISDAAFNYSTDISFRKIMSLDGAVKVFMSATGENIEEYLKNTVGLIPVKYQIPIDWNFISTLNFYYSDTSLPDFAKALIESGEKGIFFMDRAEKAYSFYKEFEQYALFCCSSQNKKYKDRMDEEKIESMLRDEKFYENMLITTTCLDAGINIIDPLVRYVFVDVKDVGSLIQCIGRKRIQSEDDTIHVYIKAITNQQLGGMETFTKNQLNMAKFLKENTTEEFIKKYYRKIDRSQIVYDEIINDGNEQTCTKKVNELMYYKKLSSINEIEHMKKFGDYGYCKYIARKFGKYDSDTGTYDYSVISEKNELEEYLAKQVGHIMYRQADRKELIEMMNVRQDGHLRRSREILNAALQEGGFPYQIEEFKTSMTVDGKRKWFKAAWRVVHHEWEK